MNFSLQDALLRAWRGLPRFEGRSSLRSWLYRIATNSCLQVLQLLTLDADARIAEITAFVGTDLEPFELRAASPI